MVIPSLAMKGTKMSDIFFVALEYKFGFFDVLSPDDERPSTLC